MEALFFLFGFNFDDEGSSVSAVFASVCRREDAESDLRVDLSAEALWAYLRLYV